MSQAGETNLDNVDIDTLLDTDDDKVYGAMGVAKTISTVCLCCAGCERWLDAVTHRVDRVLGGFQQGNFETGTRSDYTHNSVHAGEQANRCVFLMVHSGSSVHADTRLLDLFDNMYELVDSLTFKLASIAPNMWPVFELTYGLFKSDAIDFLDGERCAVHRWVHTQ